jgi:hypothetical protein
VVQIHCRVRADQHNDTGILSNGRFPCISVFKYDECNFEYFVFLISLIMANNRMTHGVAGLIEFVDAFALYLISVL